MGRKGKFLITFLLVLVGTLVLVSFLSAATHDSPQDAAARYMEELHAQEQAQGLSAPAMGQQGVPVIASLAGFLCILAVPVTGWLMMAKARRDRQRVQERRQSRRERRGISPSLKYRV